MTAGREQFPLDPWTVPLAGGHVVEAAAGAGKTFSLATLYLRLVIERGLDVSRILVVTFTEAATEELRERIRRRLREAGTALAGAGALAPELAAIVGESAEDRQRALGRVRQALDGFDEAAVHTIHGFCRRMLVENAFESGVFFETEIEADSSAAMAEIAADFWARETYSASPFLVRYLLRQKIDPVSLADLVRIASTQPDRVILPETGDLEDPEPAFRTAFNQARSIWQAGHDAVGRLVADNPALKQNCYPPGSIPGWLREITEFFEPETGDNPTLPEKLIKFTPESLTAGTRKNQATPRHPFFDACGALVRAEQNLGAIVPAFKRRLVVSTRMELQRRKIEENRQSFDDLLYQLDDALSGPGGERLADAVRERFAAVLIDEFQDTDEVQYRIFRRIHAGTEAPFFLIGDPKQSIFGFRGADVFTYLQAVRDAGGAPLTLGTNYRSDRKLVRAVNVLFSAVEAPFQFPEIGYRSVTARPEAPDALRMAGCAVPPFQIGFLSRSGAASADGFSTREWANAQLPARVAAEAVRWLREGSLDLADGMRAIRPGDIAILVRKNSQVAPLQEALRRLGVPSVQTSNESVFQSEDAEDLGRFLAAAANPADDGAVRAALATVLFGLDGEEIWSLQADDRGWEEWLEKFRIWRDQWQASGVLPMLRSVFASRPRPEAPPVIARVLAVSGGERRMTNLLHLAELLHAAARERHLGPLGLRQWLERQRTADHPEQSEAELRLESDADAVKLVTIHKAKGLEYPIVFCPYLWDGRVPRRTEAAVVFHDPDDGLRSKLDVGSSRWAVHADLAAAENQAEDRRLLYVALTRARHGCLVVWGAIKGMPDSALRHLLHPAGTNDPAFSQRLSGFSDAEIRADLECLAASSSGAIAVTELAEADGRRYEPQPGVLPRLAPRLWSRKMDRFRRVSSFTGLLAEGPILSGAAAEGHDFDQPVRPGLSPAMLTRIAPADGGAGLPLAEFDRGFTAGRCLHAIFEAIDFRVPLPAVLEDVVAAKLAAFGYDPSAWTERVIQAVAETVSAELAPGVRLRDIPPDRRLNELEFVFPVHRDRGGSPVTGRDLATVFERFPGPGLPADYPGRLRNLGFMPLAGFLKGFIDLVFEAGGRWHLADYKSNHLGACAADYRPERLAEVMTGGHYLLQYHLYLVALHRFLLRRLPDYDYDTHLGQVYYLFVRGISPQTGPSGGIFRDRPPRRLVEALSALMDRPPGGGGQG